jgi:hypothetical protein
MHEQEPAEGEVERHAGRRLKLEKISGDLLESGATFAAEVLQRLGTERAVDLKAPRGRPSAALPRLGRSDVKAAHAWAKPDGGKHVRRGALPHPGLIVQTLIFFGVARMHVTVGIGFAGFCHDHLGPCW